jgi:threonine dehydrogenase-like Zn-dependent dehydrogenase
MKAVVVHGARDLRIDDIPTPTPQPDQVSVRVIYGGICGSDLHYYDAGRNGDYLVREPLVLGHEVVAVVEEVGADAMTEITPGTVVAIHPARPTPPPGGVLGRGLHIQPGSYLGSASTNPHTQGAFAERILVNPDQLRPFAPDVPLRRAALAEPLAVALHGVDRAGVDYTGQRVAVLGAGPIGCLAIAALHRRGAASITAVDLRSEPLETARALGASATVHLGGGESPEDHGFDVVIEASGSPRALSSAVAAVRAAGTIVQLGILPSGELPIALGAVVAKEVTLRGSQRFDIELDEAVRMITETPALDAVVTHVFGLEDAAQAFATAMDPGDSLKVLLAVSPEP